MLYLRRIGVKVRGVRSEARSLPLLQPPAPPQHADTSHVRPECLHPRMSSLRGFCVDTPLTSIDPSNLNTGVSRDTSLLVDCAHPQQQEETKEKKKMQHTFARHAACGC